MQAAGGHPVVCSSLPISIFTQIFWPALAHNSSHRTVATLCNFVFIPQHQQFSRRLAIIELLLLGHLTGHSLLCFRPMLGVLSQIRGVKEYFMPYFVITNVLLVVLWIMQMVWFVAILR
jgi:hypothetical protein